jgi:hypothetical protein
VNSKDLLDFKKKYNDLLLRHEKACMYLDNTAVPVFQKDKWLPEFQKLIHEMDYIIIAIENAGHYVTVQNILNGFYYEESEGTND